MTWAWNVLKSALYRAIAPTRHEGHPPATPTEAPRAPLLAREPRHSGSGALRADQKIETLQLERLRGRAQRKFPLQYLKSNPSVLCVFAGVNEGRTELIHLYESDVHDVEVVDESPDSLHELSEIFPSYWRYTAADILEFCSAKVGAGQAFDVTIADGSGGTIHHAWETLLPHLLAVTRGYALLRITGAYLDEYDLTPTAGDIARLASLVHGINVEVINLITRSRHHQGTYWVVIGGMHNRRHEITTARPTVGRALTFADITYGKGRCIVMEDHFGGPNCARHDQCVEHVNSMRRSICKYERTVAFRLFTSERFMAVPRKRIDAWGHAASIIDLDRFRSMNEVWEQARVVTKREKKRRTVSRLIKRAQGNGYFVKQFHLKTYVPDIYEVNHSSDFRSGRPMSSGYRKSIAEMGGYPDRHYEPEAPLCLEHHWTYWGVFKSEPGRTIGSVPTNDRLVGYAYLFRCGNLARYSRFMGHGNYLSEGIMYLLHFDLLQHLLENRPPGLRYLQYSGIFSRGGSYMWKRHCLFEPKYIIYDDAGDWRGPRGMTYLSDAEAG